MKKIYLMAILALNILQPTNAVIQTPKKTDFDQRLEIAGQIIQDQCNFYKQVKQPITRIKGLTEKPKLRKLKLKEIGNITCYITENNVLTDEIGTVRELANPLGHEPEEEKYFEAILDNNFKCKSVEAPEGVRFIITFEERYKEKGEDKSDKKKTEVPFYHKIVK